MPDYGIWMEWMPPSFMSISQRSRFLVEQQYLGDYVYRVQAIAVVAETSRLRWPGIALLAMLVCVWAPRLGGAEDPSPPAVGTPVVMGHPDLTVTRSNGHYVNIAYQVTDQLEVGTYHSEIYPYSNDRGGSRYATKDGICRGWLKDWAVATRYGTDEHWTRKIEGHLMNGTALVSSLENTTWTQHWFLLAAKTTFSF